MHGSAAFDGRVVGLHVPLWITSEGTGRFRVHWAASGSAPVDHRPTGWGVPMGAGLDIYGLPVFDHPEPVRSAAAELTKAARAVHRTAAAVQVDWFHMAGAYNAPEQGQVLRAMTPPADRALALVDKAEIAEAALSAYAERLTELDARRSQLVLDILAFREHQQEVEWANSQNDRWDNVTDLWAEESVHLLQAEESLNVRVADLKSAKDRAENECANAIGDAWGAPHYSLAGETNVKSPYVNGQTGGGYVSLSRTGQAPWGRPALWTEGDWTVKKQMLEDGAVDTVVDGVVFAGTVAGLGREGRTEAARSGLSQFGADAATLLTVPGLMGSRAAAKEASARRLGGAAISATGWGTWRTSGWHTAGGFIPDAVLGVATGGTYVAPRAALRSAMASRHLPIGMTLNPTRLVPVIQSRARQSTLNAHTRLSRFLETNGAHLAGSAPVFAGPIGHRLPQQTPPSSLTSLNSMADGANGPGAGASGQTGAPSGDVSSGGDIPPVIWEEKFEVKTLRADYSPEVVDATLPLIDRARAVEPAVTADFLSSLPEDARSHGLEYRIKSPDSLASKFDRKSPEVDGGLSSIAMTDVLRYTAVVGTHEDLISATQSMVTDLSHNGWVVTSAQHSYVMDSPYKGIHCIVHSDNLDVSVELQFHTEQSQAVKTDTHPIYEVARDPRASPANRAQADAFLRRASDDISMPTGLDHFKQLGGVKIRTIVYSPDRT